MENKKLAIKGHSTRGQEVIEILEMMGGKNYFHMDGFTEEYIYYICEEKDNQIHSAICPTNQIVFSLEEFEEKFPYKVGDKVITKDKFIGTITDIRWQGDNFFFGKEEGDIVYTVQVSTTAQITYQKEDLQPYKEETFGECIEKTINECLFGSDEETMMEGVYAYNEINCYHQDFGDKVRIRLGNDFEIKIEDNVTYIVKKLPQYPSSYEECCEVLNTHISNVTRPIGWKENLISKFQELIICRDAYWKIAGEEMGLGKPWEPDWTNNHYQKKWMINFYQEEINLTTGTNAHFVLVFPTKEMRDIFYENFKKLIEQCKEFL